MNTQKNPIPPTLEKGGGEKILQHRYITKAARIRNILDAGERLVQARQNAYEFPDGKVPKNAMPGPLSRRDLDVTDIEAMVYELDERLINAKLELEKLQKQKQEDSRSNSETPPEPPESTV